MAVPPEERSPGGDVRIGVDEWVATVEERRVRRGRLVAPIAKAWERMPGWSQLGLVVALAASFPLLTDSDYLLRVGVITILFALLALGLNVVVGFAGLLDLGYVAFFGFGAYVYAVLSSDKFDLHWPAEATIPLAVVGSAILGLVLGLPSRRLLGDYLAIVTLFFGQIFVTVVSNADRITPPWRDTPVDFTGGPNGIPGLDLMTIFGIELADVQDYFYFSLVVFAVVLAALHLLNESRTGRAWRSLREDPLAAELMGMPVNRLKLLAFAFGAAIAGLTGTIFAAVQLGVFPGDFQLELLIIVYAMVILGGTGSLTGVVIGAVIINVVLEVLRFPDDARLAFYGLVLLLVLGVLRPWWRSAAVLGATLAFGFAAHALVGAISDRWTAGTPQEAGSLRGAIEAWVLLPSGVEDIGSYAFVALVIAAILVTRLHGLARTVAIVPVLYLSAFVWENKLVTEPSVTRFLLLGALLVVLMNVRPQGLLGTARVEIV